MEMGASYGEGIEGKEIEDRQLPVIEPVGFSGAAGVSETQLPLGGSAFDHQPQEVDVTAENNCTAPDVDLAATVGDSLTRLDLFGALHKSSLSLQRRLETHLAEAKQNLEAQTEKSVNYERALAFTVGESRESAWAAMPKEASGYAHGEQNLRYAVALSAREFGPHTAGESQAVIDEALADNARICQGQPTIIKHEYKGTDHYEGGIPAHDGFAIALPQPGNPYYPFAVGITEPRIPVDEAWVPESSLSPKDEAPRNLGIPLAFSSLNIRSGEQAGDFARQECDALLDQIANMLGNGSMEAGDSGSHSHEPESVDNAALMDRWYSRIATLAEAVLAARDAQQPLHAEGESAERGMRATGLLMEHFLTKGNEAVNEAIASQQTFADVKPYGRVVEALKYAFPGTDEQLAERLISESLLREREDAPAHSHIPVVWALEEYFGVPPAQAEMRVYSRKSTNQ